MNATELLRERLGEIAAAFGLLTRLPVQLAAEPRAGEAAKSAWAYPLAGAAVGAIGGAAYWLADALASPPALAALFALAAMVLATGALHEDGLADFADGLGGETREDSLAIMRDERIGTYGVIALIFSFAVRASAIAFLAAPGLAAAALIAAGAGSRAAAVQIMAALPPARTDGLSVAVGRPGAKLAFAALGLAFLLSWLLFSFGAALLIALSAGVAAAAIGSVALTRLGGQTGDVLGAGIQLAEALALASLVMLSA